MSYTPAQKRAFAIRMAKKRAAEKEKKAAPARRKTTTTTRRKTTPRRSYYEDDRYTDGAFGEMVGSGIGSFLGGGPGAMAGGALGKGAHKLFKRLTGFGDYNVVQNSLMRGGMSPPEIVNSSNRGGVIVRHREYIGDINATVDFTVSAFPINPGLAVTFPWLSTMAGSFEQYRMRGAVFEFKSLSSDAVLSSATSSALGAVVMATDYNVLGPNFANKLQMENYEYANSSKPSCGFLHPIECKRSRTPVTELYVRTGAVPSDADARLYDLGLFQIATVGMQAASGVAGELWISYEIELLKPRLSPTPGALADHFEFTGSISGTVPFGSTRTLATGSNLGGHVNASPSNAYFFPVGTPGGSRFLVTYVNQGSSVTVVAPIVVFANCSVTDFYSDASVSVAKAPQDSLATTTQFMLQFVIQIDSTVFVEESTSFEFNTAGTLPDGGTACDLIVTSIPSNLGPPPGGEGLKRRGKKKLKVIEVSASSEEELVSTPGELL